MRGKPEGAGPSQRYETRFGPKQNDAGIPDAPDRTKRVGYRLSTEIERTTDLQKVLEERILDNKVELSLREVLGVAMKEFHDSIVDLVKRKRLSTEPEPEKTVEVRTTHIEDMALEDEWAESHYSRPSDHGNPGEDRRCPGTGGSFGGPRIGNQPDVHGLL